LEKGGEMKIKKIKATKPDFSDGGGPSETVTLGFSVGNRDFILGTYYFGPGMNTNHVQMFGEIEDLIDQIVGLSRTRINSGTLSVLKAVTDYAARNTCLHEETHRGGAIWEICDQCGMKWADDEGGMPANAHELPKEIEDAYDLILELGGAV
jgi:hypothetical protein